MKPAVPNRSPPDKGSPNWPVNVQLPVEYVPVPNIGRSCASLSARRTKATKVAPARTTAGAKATTFATEGHKVFGIAGVTTRPQEAMFQTAAFQLVFEFLLDILRQFRTLCGQALVNEGVIPEGAVLKSTVAMQAAAHAN